MAKPCELIQAKPFGWIIEATIKEDQRRDDLVGDGKSYVMRLGVTHVLMEEMASASILRTEEKDRYMEQLKVDSPYYTFEAIELFTK